MKRSGCPIGSPGYHLPDDVSVIEEQHTRVILQGRINTVAAPDEANFSPFHDYYTAPLYVRKGCVKYLKFRTKQELDWWGLARDDRVVCRGCLHYADGREVVFDVTIIEHEEKAL